MNDVYWISTARNEVTPISSKDASTNLDWNVRTRNQEASAMNNWGHFFKKFTLQLTLELISKLTEGFQCSKTRRLKRKRIVKKKTEPKETLKQKYAYLQTVWPRDSRPVDICSWNHPKVFPLSKQLLWCTLPQHKNSLKLLTLLNNVPITFSSNILYMCMFHKTF